jgi:hypothetical protein
MKKTDSEHNALKIFFTVKILLRLKNIILSVKYLGTFFAVYYTDK